jgi:hypothetical protein
MRTARRRLAEFFMELRFRNEQNAMLVSGRPQRHVRFHTLSWRRTCAALCQRRFDPFPMVSRGDDDTVVGSAQFREETAMLASPRIARTCASISSGTRITPHSRPLPWLRIPRVPIAVALAEFAQQVPIVR